MTSGERRCPGRAGRDAPAGARALPRRSRPRAPHARRSARRVLELAQESADQAALDRVARPVLVVDVAARRRRRVRSRPASDADLASVRVREPARVRARLVRRQPASRARPGLVVRGLDSGLELESANALEDPLGHHPLAGERVADHPEPNIWTAAMASTAPRISDWTWPLRSPLRIQSSRNGVQAASAASRRAPAATREHPQRLVQGVGAEDRDRVAAHVARRSSRTGASPASSGWSRSGRARPRPASCPPGSGSPACR